ncbi:protein kinase domain-containing protein [Streptomyces sp. CA-249302]|uniref:protein kinase domain-containing protein n=1 Tax=Streptomyces sp. CA-249302 TaxID=3240058 RepID=UPI003D8AC51A
MGDAMAVGWIVLIVVGAVIVLLPAVTVRVVPQASCQVVERFGRYTRTMNAGLNIVVPFIDRIRNRVDLREQFNIYPPESVITEDRVVIDVDMIVYYQVTDGRYATYEVDNYVQSIQLVAFNTLRNIVGGMDLQMLLASREEINAALRGVLDERTSMWGVRVNQVELKTIDLPEPLRRAEEEQMRANSEKRAAILRAEGERQAALVQAETERAVAAARGDQDGAGDRKPAYTPAARRPVHEPLHRDDPRRLGSYRLRARLGQGGMGTVYLGVTPGERLVAVKVIKKEFTEEPMFRKRFRREIDSVQRVGGFHTAPVVDADADGDPPWLATEYIPGPSLDDVLKQVGALPTRTLYTLALGVADALRGIHVCGIVHRDLKPSNIIVSGMGPRIIDFGLARALDGSKLTRSGHVVGTLGFLAPEQFTGAQITPATDMYAFGTVLCHAAGAAPLRDGESLESALELLPAGLVGVITRCRETDPALRPLPDEVLKELSPGPAPSEDWLPPHIRTMVDLHNRPTVSAP